MVSREKIEEILGWFGIYGFEVIKLDIDQGPEIYQINKDKIQSVNLVFPEDQDIAAMSVEMSVTLSDEHLEIIQRMSVDEQLKFGIKLSYEMSSCPAAFLPLVDDDGKIIGSTFIEELYDFDFMEKSRIFEAAVKIRKSVIRFVAFIRYELY